MPVHFFTCVVFALTCFVSLPVCGGTFTWTGAANNDFNNTANWSLTTPPDNGGDGIPSTADSVILPPALATTINVTTTVATTQIYHYPGVPGSFTIGGQPLITAQIRSDNALPFVLSNSLSSTGNMTIQPANATSSIDIQGVITAVGGSFGLAGAGRIDLRQANTFTAGLTTSGVGLTVIHNPLALGNGGLLQVSSSSNHTLGLVSDLNWNGDLRLAHSTAPGTLNARIQSGTGDRTFTVRGGTTNNPGTIVLGPNEAGSSGDFILKFERTSAGTTIIRNPISSGDNSIVNLHAVSGANFNLSSGTAVSEATATISGSGKLVKSGAGTALISVEQTYTGGTDINEGIVQLISPGGSLPDSGRIKLEAGTTLDFNGVNDTVGTLAGAGTVDLGGAAITASQGLQPGASPGTLSIEGAGSLTISGLSIFELDSLSGPNDLVQFNGPADLQLGGVLQIINLGGLEIGEYTLFELNGGVINGSFDEVIIPGFTGTILQSGGNIILSVSLVPEPSTAILAWCGLIPLARCRRRCKNSRGGVSGNGSCE